MERASIARTELAGWQQHDREMFGKLSQSQDLGVELSEALGTPMNDVPGWPPTLELSPSLLPRSNEG